MLANVLRANQRRISIDEIQTRVAEHYCIRKAEMVSARRAREVARPRQVAMYLSKQLTPKSLPDIGRRFGGRDHTPFPLYVALAAMFHLRRASWQLRVDDAAVQRLIATEAVALLPPFARSMLGLERPGLDGVAARVLTQGMGKTLRWAFRQG